MINHDNAPNPYKQSEGSENKPNFNLNILDADDIIKNIEKLENELIEANENEGLFTVMPANKWIEQAKSRPIPQMLFGELWFQNELCILFADTNLGKSILAVQIGNSISKGEQINGFKLENKKQPVLYFDFELTDKQFERRYSIEYNEHYNFDSNFIRVEINPEANIPEKQSFEEFLHFSIERAIIKTGAKVLIIDNITYLRIENEKARDALPLMKQLKALKHKYNLSLLVLAHTPKRDLSKPITRNDLQGSKMLINFCDSCFSIGESATDKNLRYIKQIKQRNTEQIYDAENVCLCQIDKPNNFLKFDFIGYGKELEHLKQHTEKDTEKLKDRVLELSKQGLSYREIGNELGMSHSNVGRILKKCNKL
jgi:RecA-family ATPase